ncbi:MAG: tRNA (N6-threonylcarbamoyladenosine(37)-N6)-methyltransferase TrmO [Chloroflexota bacterium]|nr:tRNA (N6-threonylcarbamoyladenosine(37)-N6)-methyltransferase TrmO [Chloroflexota bacterium]
MKSALWIDPSGGISCKKFAAALIGLGVPEQGMMRAMDAAEAELGLLDTHSHVEFLPDGSLAHRLHITFLEQKKPLSLEDAANKLNKMLPLAEVEGEYAVAVKRALSILSTGEAQSVSAASSPPVETVQLSVIGEAHTPYEHKAPYQPASENISDGVFFIQVAPQFIDGLAGLETFSHILVFAYLDRSQSAKLSVRPPWTEGQDEYGVFATRSPNRPSPIGLSRTRLQRIEGDRIYTGPLDLFNRTPIVDIKPFIRSLDTADRPVEEGNDGWLQGSDHLELHRLGIPHEHPESAERLHEIERLLVCLIGIGWGLQQLNLDLRSIRCTSPVLVGQTGELSRVSQGIMTQYHIPHEQRLDVGESLTADGAAILAAIAPDFVARDQIASEDLRVGFGVGGEKSALAPCYGALRLLLV